MCAASIAEADLDISCVHILTDAIPGTSQRPMLSDLAAVSICVSHGTASKSLSKLTR